MTKKKKTVKKVSQGPSKKSSQPKKHNGWRSLQDAIYRETYPGSSNLKLKQWAARCRVTSDEQLDIGVITGSPFQELHTGNLEGVKITLDREGAIKLMMILQEFFPLDAIGNV
jgi:hypothetical protein